MKRLCLIIVLLVSVIPGAISQTKEESDMKLIYQFLNYINDGGWTFETVIDKYVLFRKEESPYVSRAKRKEYLSLALSNLKVELDSNKLPMNEYIIKPYLEVDSSYRTMFLSDSTARCAYVVYSNATNFKRYFLVERSKISSFLTFKNGKVFLQLN